MSASSLRIALVHDWLTGMRGGEYVLEAIAELFPKAELFTLLYVPGSISPVLTTLKRHTSALQRIPGAAARYRHFLPLMPRLIESFDLSGFDLVLSSSHCVAKGIRKPEGAVHLSYVHAPMRYMWDRFDDYFGPGRASPWVRLGARTLRKRLQEWDRASSAPERIDSIIANSRYIGEQIFRHHGRQSDVVYPFADLSRFDRPRANGRNYLIVGAFAPYKRVDVGIEAFNRLGLPLLVVGGGQDEKRLKKLAGPTIDFLGQLSNDAITDLYSKCRAFVFPGLEDFGITPLEAMASGAPVIAYGEGGASETVTPETGVFFTPQTVDALMDAVMRVESGEVTFTEDACRERARHFSKERFQREYVNILRRVWKDCGKPAEPLDAILRAGWADVSPSL